MLFSPRAGLGFRIGRESLNGLGFSRINAYRPPTTSDTQFVRTARYSATWMPMPFSPEGTHVSVITLSVPDCTHSIKNDATSDYKRLTFNNFQNDHSCVAFYKFESGALGTDSRQSNDLTEVGTPVADTTNYKEGASGVLLRAADSDYLWRGVATSDDSNWSDNFPLKNGTSNGQLTICAWVRMINPPSVVGGDKANAIFTKYDSSANRRCFTFRIECPSGTGQYLKIVLGHTAGTLYEDSLVHGTSLRPLAWYHCSCTFDATTRAYSLRLRDENGNKIGTDVESTFTNDISYVTEPWRVGAQFAGGAYWAGTTMDGTVDELVVFNRVLTETEINKIAQGQYDYESVTIASSTHTLTNDAIDLTVTVAGAGSLLDLTVADGRQPQSAESPTLTQERTLVVSDSRHPQTADAPALTQDRTLVVADSRHNLTGDIVTLMGMEMTLVVSDSRHTNQTPVIILGLDTEVIGIASSRHQQTADSPTLTLEQTLVVADSRHNLTHDAINLTMAVGGDITLTVAEARHNLRDYAPVTGSFTQANSRLSIVNGTAFADFSSAGSLTPHIGKRLIITDNAGKKLTGFIKEAGTGETYGDEKLANTTYEDTVGLGFNCDAIDVVAGGETGNCLRGTYSGWQGIWQYRFNVADIGGLYRLTSYMKLGTASWYGLSISDGDWNYIKSVVDNKSSWTSYTLYATSPTVSIVANHDTQGSSGTLFIDTESLTPVLTPSVTGVTIVSTSGGATYNWESEETGFNRNDSGGYTYEIEAAIEISYEITLAVTDSRHAQSAESPTLTQERTLVVSDSSHRQTAESPTLTQERTLVVADSRHPQVSDSPTLQQDKTLVVADCSNRNFTAAINLQQDLALLVVSDARHNLTNDTINLTIGADVVLTLTVAESRHTNTSDIIILPRERTLTVADSRHTDTSDAIALQQERTLVVSGITHTNRPDPIALLQKIVLSVQGSGHTVTNDIVGFAYEMMLGIAGDRITNIPDSIALSIDLWGALGLFHETSMQDITPDRTITGLIPLSIVNMTAEREIEEYGKLSMVDITDERNVA